MSDDRELSDLYQSADKPQPSAALDSFIKATARQPLKSRRSYALQWIGGVAATVLAALLVVQMLPVVKQQADYEGMKHDAPAEAPAHAEKAQTNRPARQVQPGAVQSLAPRKKPGASMAEDAMLRQPAAPAVAAKSELQAISRLLEAGETGEALTRFRAFRQQHPGFEVPEALRKQIQALETSGTHP